MSFDLSLCWLNPSVVDAALRPAVVSFFEKLAPSGRMPAIVSSLPVDDYAVVEPAPTKCALGPAPGVALFRRAVLSHLGGGDTGICACRTVAGRTELSDHSAGKAWDWKLDAGSQADAARAQALIDWLLAPDHRGEPHANLRRAGIRYLIWNRQVWSTLYKTWKPYTGQSPHTDHMHLSWGTPGAEARTSLYAALGGSTSGWVGLGFGLAVGAGAAYLALR